jgi:hypothetical protein
MSTIVTAIEVRCNDNELRSMELMESISADVIVNMTTLVGYVKSSESSVPDDHYPHEGLYLGSAQLVSDQWSFTKLRRIKED